MKLSLENKTEYSLLNQCTLKKIAKKVLKLKNQPTRKIGLSVFYVDEDEIQQINKEYRGKDKPTDVITFRLVNTVDNLPLDKEHFPLEYDSKTGIYLGEIFICAQVAERQAAEWKHSTNREVAELFVHGMLHMLGHDHEKEQEAKIMKDLEQQMFPLLDKLVG